MKFINYLESITGIAIYPLISFILFFIFFAFVSFYAIRASKQHMSEVANIPLDSNEKQSGI